MLGFRTSGGGVPGGVEMAGFPGSPGSVGGEGGSLGGGGVGLSTLTVCVRILVLNSSSLQSEY